MVIKEKKMEEEEQARGSPCLQNTSGDSEQLVTTQVWVQGNDQMEIEVQELVMHKPFSRLGGITWQVSVPERRNQLWQEEGKLTKQTDKETREARSTAPEMLKEQSIAQSTQHCLEVKKQTEPSNKLLSTNMYVCSLFYLKCQKKCTEVQRWQRPMSLVVASSFEHAKEKMRFCFCCWSCFVWLVFCCLFFW